MMVMSCGGGCVGVVSSGGNCSIAALSSKQLNYGDIELGARYVPTSYF